jgi:hypothetical protein
MIKKEFFDNRAITEVLFNLSTPLVSIFKDCLIADDVCEFLNVFYQNLESHFAIAQAGIFQQIFGTNLQELIHISEFELKEQRMLVNGIRPIYFALDKLTMRLMNTNRQQKYKDTV